MMQTLRRVFFTQNASAESGSILTAALGVVVLVGTLSYTAYSLLSGPVRTAAVVTMKTKAQNEMMIGAKLLMRAASDTDVDNVAEPPASDMVVIYPGNGNAMNSVLCNGKDCGAVPLTNGADKTDPWHTPYGYCVWNHGSTHAAGGGYLEGIDGLYAGRVALALISAGPDKIFQTNCGNDDGINPQIFDKNNAATEGVAGDDILVRYTYEQATNIELWKESGGVGLETSQATQNVGIGKAADAAFKLDVLGNSKMAGDVTMTGGTLTADSVDLKSGFIDAAAITNSSIDGTTIGASTPSTGNFTTLTASTTSTGALTAAGLISLSGTGLSAMNGVAIGGTTPSTGIFTDLSWTGVLTPPNTTVVTNLNADLLDGQHGSYYLNASNLTSGTIPPGQMPALTGDVGMAAGTTVTVVQGLQGRQLSGGAPVVNQVIGWNGTQWTPMSVAVGPGDPSTVGVGGVNFLATDTNITSVACSAGQIPKYDGTNWACAADSTSSSLTLTGDVTGSGTGSFATLISNDSVTFAKMQNVSTNVILGRSTAATGDIEELTVGAGLSLAGGVLSASAPTVTWGMITGTLSDQTDLQAALDVKVAGPGTVTDSAIATFDGTTGYLIKDSGWTIIGDTIGSTSRTKFVSGGDGETVSLIAADAISSGVSGGTVTISSGGPDIPSADGGSGNINLNVPAAFSGAAPGDITLTAGDAEKVVGGNIILKPGGSRDDKDGYVKFFQPEGSFYLTLDTGLLTQDRKLRFPDQDDTLATLSDIAGAAGTPGGANTELQYNNSGAFGGITGATTNGTTVTLTSPTIAKLANLTTNGFIKTTGGDGTLTVDTGTYLTGNQTITLSGDVSGSGTTAITTTIGAAKVTSAMLRNSAALSVIGRSANSAGVPADIAATAASDAVLRESGSTIGFGTIATGGIANNAVTFAKIQTIGSGSFLARSTAGTGNVEELTTAQVKSLLSISGTNTGDQTITLTGDVTGSGTGSFAATIANDAVTFAKIQNITTGRLLGRTTAGAGDTEMITPDGTLTLAALGLGVNLAHDFTWTGIHKFSAQIRDASNVPSIYTEGRSLYDPGGNEILNWGSLVLIDSGSTYALDWANRLLYDSSTQQSVDWQNRRLLKADGSIALDWSAGAVGGYALSVESGDRALDGDADNNKRFSNLGAGGDIRLDLPACVVGRKFALVVSETNFIGFRLDGATTLYLGDTKVAAHGTIRSKVLHATLEIECIHDDIYITTSSTGSWRVSL